MISVSYIEIIMTDMIRERNCATNEINECNGIPQ